MDDLKSFRTHNSLTPGHPEYGHTAGVEITTGPLGSGISSAVGMAMAARYEKGLFDPENKTDLFDHNIWVICSDGDLQEGMSAEASSLAGTQALGNLKVIYDDNRISIEGDTHVSFTEDVSARYRAYGWNVIGPIDGHDAAVVSQAIASAKLSTDKPTLIVCKTSIGKGSPNRANTAKAHGEPLGAEEIALTRAAIGWDLPHFEIPQDVYDDWSAVSRGQQEEAEWNKLFSAYQRAHPELAKEYQRRMAGDLPKHFSQTVVDAVIDSHTKAETVATRKASQLALEAFTANLPELLGGSADLTGSNLTNTKSTPNFRVDLAGDVVTYPSTEGHRTPDDTTGRHINYGVREFGMAAIMNGVALHGGFIPYGGTFLTFSDYSRNAIRMAALMKQRVIHVFTHDSIGLGEDGPTHQSIEHAASLRLIPNLDVWRPADTAETTVAWAVALQNQNRPTALLLSRQNLPYLPKGEARTSASTQAAGEFSGLDAINKGAYVLAEPSEVGMHKAAQAVIVATGSEVQLALKAQALLAERKIAVRVVSMPSTTTFDRQSVAYKSAVLPKGLPRVAVEMGSTDGWWKYGVSAVVGIDTYGESAPAGVLFKHFGFTPENVADTVQKVLSQ